MKNAFVVSACSKYLPELTALLNSLDQIGNNHPVHLIAYNLPNDFIGQIGALSYPVHVYEIPETEAREFGGEGEILCRKRYWYAAEWGVKYGYDAVCVLDADMYFVRPVDQFFEIAAKCGYICGAGLEQKRIYGVEPHQKVGGVQLIPPTWNAKDIACAPLFFAPAKWEALFKRCWTIFAEGFPETNFKAPDMESYNLLILAGNHQGDVHLLSNYSLVGTNEKLLKPYTRMTVQGDNLLWTEGGEPIYIVHGQWYKARWRRQQLLNRHGCAEGYLGFAEKSDSMAAGAMNGLYEWFLKCLNGKLKIDSTKAYVHNGDPKIIIDEQELPVGAV